MRPSPKYQLFFVSIIVPLIQNNGYLTNEMAPKYNYSSNEEDKNAVKNWVHITYNNLLYIHINNK